MAQARKLKTEKRNAATETAISRGGAEARGRGERLVLVNGKKNHERHEIHEGTGPRTRAS